MEYHTSFPRRHLGCNSAEAAAMASTCGFTSVDELINTALPEDIRLEIPLNLPAPLSEKDSLQRLAGIMDNNKVIPSLIGQGYYNTITPPVIARCVFENPGWYTAYTPYQAEIAQGRLEVLLTFQSMISDLTSLPVANASLLDEGTAAAEAMTLCLSAKPQSSVFFVSEKCHPQTIDIVRTRAKPLGLEIIVSDHASFDPASHGELFGALVQYPDTEGKAHDFSPFAVFLLFGITGILCEATINPAGAFFGIAQWIFIYGLMVYLPAYCLPQGRGARPVEWYHYVFFVPAVFLIALPLLIPIIYLIGHILKHPSGAHF